MHENIYCCNSSEAPRRRASNEYPQLMFSKILELFLFRLFYQISLPIDRKFEMIQTNSQVLIVFNLPFNKR